VSGERSGSKVEGDQSGPSGVRASNK
jgi:hypothetical protein